MNLEDYIASGILEQYCLGLTSEDENREVEYMAAQHPEVQEILQQLHNGLEAYAAAHSIPPPDGLKGRVMQKVDEAISEAAPSGNKRPIRSIPSKYYYLTAAASIALLILGGLAFVFYQKQEQARKELAAISQQVQKLQEDYKTLSNSHQALQQEYVLLKDIGTHHVQMVGSENAPKAQCVLYWNPEHKGAYLNIVNLPPPPHGHQYQVWADVEGHHHNMGLINGTTSDSDSSLLHPLPYIENSRGFVITLEKQGGSEHPSVDKLFVKGDL